MLHKCGVGNSVGSVENRQQYAESVHPIIRALTYLLMVRQAVHDSSAMSVVPLPSAVEAIQERVEARVRPF